MKIKKEIRRTIEQIRELGWSVSMEENSTYVELSKYSPAGQDFFFTIDTENDRDRFIDNIYNYYENFDVSYETYLWLDESGHGKNGAPYDMKDLYEDMEACEKMIKELYDSL